MQPSATELYQGAIVGLVVLLVINWCRTWLYRTSLRKLADATFAYLVDPDGGAHEYDEFYDNKRYLVEELSFALGASENVIESAIRKYEAAKENRFFRPQGD